LVAFDRRMYRRSVRALDREDYKKWHAYRVDTHSHNM